MNKIELGLYIDNFVKLNPKKNTRPNIVKFEQNSFFVIQNCFKENKKYIITSNYNDIFYYKKSKLVGKKWIEILLSSKDIFEYHKRIRDDFPYCKPRKLIRILINDLFYLFKNNIPNILIEDTEKKFNNELKNQLEKIRKFLDDQDWSNYFFNLQTIMHEQIIKFLGWNKSLNFNDYSNLFFKKMILFVKVERVKKLLQFIQKVNLYRNTLSKPNSVDKEYSKRLLNEWNTLTKLMKVIEAKHIYNQLLDFIDIINLLKNKKSI